MSEHNDQINTPLPLLIAAALLIGTVLAITTVSKFTGFGSLDVSTGTQVERLALNFRDEPDGGVGAYDPVSGEQVFEYAPGAGGFVRTALRALALDRRKAGIGPEPAYELTRTSKGQFLLHDPSTSKSITLNAFGSTNAGDFAQLFDAHNGGADG